jgi:hypothetical protein
VLRLGLPAYWIQQGRWGRYGHGRPLCSLGGGGCEAVLSPYLTARIQRFGVYATDEIALTPEPFDARLGFDLAVAS